MENETKEVNTTKPKPVKRDRRWTLLFIGDRGKTITFKNFKGVVITVIFMLLATAAVAGGFYYLYRDETRKSDTLQNEMDNLQRVLTSLRNEKEILMARLVVAESRVKETYTKNDTPEPEPENEPARVRLSGVTLQSDQKSGSSQSEPMFKVDVDGFIVFHEPDINMLRVEYKVRNVGSKEQPVSGKTVVVLKNTDEPQSKWLPLPSVPLVSGKPTGQWGRSFSIFNFRTIRFKVNDQPGPDQFNTATVFVYSLTGDMLLEKDFAVGIKSQRISTQ
jgi:hypothetical protein